MLAGASVTEVAAAVRVSRVSVHAWLRRYLTEGLAGLIDRSHRPGSCHHQTSDHGQQQHVAKTVAANPRVDFAASPRMLQQPTGLPLDSRVPASR